MMTFPPTWTLLLAVLVFIGRAPLSEADTPIIMCNEPAFREGNRYRDITCNITSADVLLCDEVSWSFGYENEVTIIGEKYKDTTGKYDIMESICSQTDEGLDTKLQIFEVMMAHFGTTFFVGYGSGDKVPVQIEMTGRAGGSRIMPISVFASIVMVILTTLVTRS